MFTYTSLVPILACGTFFLVANVHASPAKVVSETIELAIKKCGNNAASVASKRAAEKALQEAVKRHGDDVLKYVESGGLKAIECGQKYGDDFWALCKKYPDASNGIANNADTLLPLVKRAGTDVIEIETKVPGLASELTEIYGINAVKHLSKQSPEDLVKLYQFGKHFPSDAPALLKKLNAEPNFLTRLSGTQLLGLGTGTGALTVGIGIGGAALQTGDGIQEGLTTMAKESPTHFSVTAIGIVIGSLMALWLLFAGGISKIFSMLKNMINPRKNKEINRHKSHATTKGEIR